MTRYSFGDIVLVNFPFTDRSAIKRRPALVIIHDDDVLLARITSKAKESSYDVSIMNWKESNLLFPSTIRLTKCVTFSSEMIQGKIGLISSSDKLAVTTAMKQLVDSLV